MCRKKSFQIAEVLEKGVSIPIVREMQIKTVIKFHSSANRWSKLKKGKEPGEGLGVAGYTGLIF